MPRLILASASPRRREILARLAPVFAVEPADIDETPRPGEGPTDYVVRLAREKAEIVSRPDTVVIGSDTSVVLDGEILGKPLDRVDGAAMLRRLSGRMHEVVTGVAVVVNDVDGTRRVAIGHERSEVHVMALTDARIAWYVETGEPDDKAGGYGLQGAGGLFADDVRGSVSNVIGLPMQRLDQLCREVNVDIVADFVT